MGIWHNLAIIVVSVSMVACGGSQGAGPQSLDNRVAFPPPQLQGDTGHIWRAKISATMLLSDAEISWQVREAQSGEVMDWVLITPQSDHSARVDIYQNGSYLIEVTVREGNKSVTRQRLVEVSGGAGGFAIALDDLPQGAEVSLYRRSGDGDGEGEWVAMNDVTMRMNDDGTQIRFINLDGHPDDYQIRMRHIPDVDEEVVTDEDESPEEDDGNETHGPGE